MTALAREEFQARRNAAQRVAEQERRVLALASVVGGAAQLAFLYWSDRHLARSPKLVIAGPLFLLYAGLVVWLLWRMQRRIRAARPVCPACGASMSEMSERVAAATGRCDQCGGAVIG